MTEARRYRCPSCLAPDACLPVEAECPECAGHGRPVELHPQMMEALAILEDARALLAQRRAWTRGELAKDSEGLPIDPPSPSATQWCAVGALRRVSGQSVMGSITLASPYWLARTILDRAAGGDAIQLNDSSRTKRPVLRMYDRAIANLRRELEAE